MSTDYTDIKVELATIAANVEHIKETVDRLARNGDASKEQLKALEIGNAVMVARWKTHDEEHEKQKTERNGGDKWARIGVVLGTAAAIVLGRVGDG